MRNKRYMDIDIISFLEEKVRANTEHYQEDFEYDKALFHQIAFGMRKNASPMLWLSRRCGTNCVKEHEAFIKGSCAHNEWLYHAKYDENPIIAFAVEITGVKNGILKGNAYELDYRAHAAEVEALAVRAVGEEKTFADGYVKQLPFEINFHHVYTLVKDHGSIVDGVSIPESQKELSAVLSVQKSKRSAMPTAEYSPNRKMPLDSVIASASKTASSTQHSKDIPMTLSR